MGTGSFDASVIWMAARGSISSAGVYTAPTTPGEDTITATSVQNSTVRGVASVIVTPGTAVGLLLADYSTTATAGVAHPFTVTAKDAYGNTAVGYSGTVHFSSSDAQANLPANTTLLNGTGTFSATLKTAGSQSITATDTVSASITGTQDSISVAASSAMSLVLSGYPNPTTAGVAHPFTVTAKDAYGNTAAGYTGTVHFSSSDAQASLPANATLLNGTGTFSATLKTAGSQSITAIDASSSALTATQSGITVASSSAASLVLSGYPSPTTAGVAYPFTVTAKDAYGNTAVGYTGTVHFSSSDAQAVLPANATLLNGTGTFSATLKTAGSQSITATDTVHAALSAGQGGITVATTSASSLLINGYPSLTTAGVAHTFTVTAKDAYGNTATGYTGTVHFSSSDAQASLPANATLLNGTGTFSATLKTTGIQSITATDTGRSSLSATQTDISTIAAPVARMFAKAQVLYGQSGHLASAYEQPGMSYRWTLTPGTTSATASGSTTGSTLTYAVGNTPGTYQLSLQVQNAAGDVATQNRTLEVLANAFVTDVAVPLENVLSTLTVLMDGRILLAGGYRPSSSNYMGADPRNPEAHLWDPSTRTWSITGGMVVPRAGHVATLLPDGRVLVAGGYGTGGYGAGGESEVLSSAELYDPATNTWTSTGSMATPRVYFTATTLTQGKILVASGHTGTQRVTTAELYDPILGTWSTLASTLTAARTDHTATLLNDGKVLIAGGFDEDGHSIPNTDLFDPTPTTDAPDGTWLATPPPMGSAHAGHTATLLDDGRVLVVGSAGNQGGSSAEVYTPTQGSHGTWASTAPLNTGRSFHAAILLPNGRVLVAAGMDEHGESPATEVYDPNLGTWSSAGDLHTPRAIAQTHLTPEGKVLLSGGWGRLGQPFSTPELYDPSTHRWQVAGGPNLRRRNATVTTLADGQVLFTGGWNNEVPDGSVTYTASTECFDPATNTWPLTGSMSTPRADHTATRLADGSVLVVGGLNGTQNALQTAERYVPGSGWATAPSPGTTRAKHAGALLADGSVLVAGGQSATEQALASSERYLPGSGWSSAGPMAIARISPTATLLPNGQVLIAGGRDASGERLASSELYTPGSGWSFAGNMATPRLYHTATLLPNGQVLVTGGQDIDGNPITSAECYTPGQGWSTVGAMGNAHYGHSATLLGNGQVAVVGGVNSTYLNQPEDNGNQVLESALPLAELYDPSTQSWSPAGSLHSPRLDHSAVLLGDGRLMVVNGYPGYIPEFFKPATSASGSSGTATTLRVLDYPSPIAAGTTSTFTVMALDAAGNLAAGYSGTLHFSSTDAHATLPADAPLSEGIGTFEATFGTVGTHSLTATDTHVASLTGNQQGISVQGASGSADFLEVSGYPTTTAAGGAHSFTVTAKDAYGNTVTGYTGTVHFSSSDSLASLPANTTLTHGTGTFTATLVTRGTHSLVATDQGDPAVMGHQTGIQVEAGSTTRLSLVLALTPVTLGTPASFTVSAWDAYGNLATDYSGQLHFTSSDGMATLPSNATLTDGAGTFTATFATPGLQSLTATDTVNTSLGGTLAGIPVLVIPAADIFAQAMVLYADTPILASTYAHGGMSYLWSLTGGTASATVSGITTASSLSYGVGNTLGTYQLDLSVQDAQGHSTQQSRTLQVIDNGFLKDVMTPIERVQHTTTVLADGRVLIVGGNVSDKDIHLSAEQWGQALARAELYDPATGTWAAAGSMMNPRVQHTATLLANGKVLIVGGTQSPNPWHGSWPGAELYDPSTNTWSTAGDLDHTRYSHTATLLPDGQVLVAGGQDMVGQLLATAELYNPSTNTWSSTGNPVTARLEHTATLLPNGQVLLAGGVDEGSVPLPKAELYTPATHTWTSIPDMATPRHRHTATLLPNGQVLMAGGSALDTAPLSKAELYTPTTNAWASVPNMGATRFNHTATLLPSGQVLMTGGISTDWKTTATAELYDPTHRTWSSVGSLRTGRSLHTSALLRDGRVLTLGGMDASSLSLASPEFYDPTTGTWSTAGGPAVVRHGHATQLLADGTLLVLGGWSTQGRTLRSAERYNPTTRAWSSAGSLNAARAYPSATLLPDGKVLVAGGLDSSGRGLANAEVYDPTANTWTFVGSLNAARGQHGALLVNGQVLVVGGVDAGGTALASAERYTPSTQTWTSAGLMATPRAGHAVTLVGGKVLVIGGMDANGNVLSSLESFDPSTNTWSLPATTGAFTGRTKHTATLLADGKVLVTGGADASGNVLTSTYLYDPSLSTWTSTGDLTEGRANQVALLLARGRVLALGGSDSSGNAIGSAEVYSPGLGTWSPVSLPLTTYRFGHTATRLDNGQVMVVGGIPGSIPEFYKSPSWPEVPDTPDYLEVTTNPTATIWTSSAFTVTAKTAYGDTVTNYRGTVHFTCSDSRADLPADATLTNGTGVFSVLFKGLGTVTLTATDTTTPLITGSQPGILVAVGPVDHLVLSGFPSTPTAGTSYTVTLSAKDRSGYAVTSYTGTVHFTSSDPLAILPANATLTNGEGTFSITLNSAGTQSITARDIANASLTITQRGITVN